MTLPPATVTCTWTGPKRVITASPSNVCAEEVVPAEVVPAADVSFGPPLTAATWLSAAVSGAPATMELVEVR